MGASANPDRYSYLAINKLVSHGHEVVAIGRKTGKVNNTPITVEQLPVENIDTITLYMNPTNQVPYYNYILSLKPARIIFNPGTENEALNQMARGKGIKTIEGCTLVMLSTGQY